ncbi:ferric iron reductase [Rhizobium sp. PDO1-076]|nr:ferric iron reductase [Rhizobium sp. PDO1-076]
MICVQGPLAVKGELPASEPKDLGSLLRAVVGERYVYASGYFHFIQPANTESIACADLLDEGRFNAVIDRYAARFPEGTDRRALVSLWSLYYVSALGMGAAIAWLELRRSLPLALDELTVLIDPSTAAPKGFLLADIGTISDRSGNGIRIHDALSPVIRDHLEPWIHAVAAHSGLGKKVLWTSAAGYIDWMIREIGRLGNKALEIEALPLIEDASWPDGWRNPLYRTLRFEPGPDGSVISQRRVCCLRYAVPGVGGCGQVCPVAEGRCGL